MKRNAHDNMTALSCLNCGAIVRVRRGATPPRCPVCWVSADGVTSTTQVRRPHPGPGTHLSRLIARFQRVLPWWDMQPHEGCGCNDTARWMDQLGPDGCEERITSIVKRLKNEARKRKITFPFQGWAAEKMVRWAIKRARKQQAVNND